MIFKVIAVWFLVLLFLFLFGSTVYLITVSVGNTPRFRLELAGSHHSSVFLTRDSTLKRSVGHTVPD